MNLKERAKKLKTDIPAVFLALKHEKTPFAAKILAALTVAWTIKLIPPEVMEECRAKSEGLWENGKPKKWYYAIPIVLFWILIAGLIVKAG